MVETNWLLITDEGVEIKKKPSPYLEEVYRYQEEVVIFVDYTTVTPEEEERIKKMVKELKERGDEPLFITIAKAICQKYNNADVYFTKRRIDNP